MSLVLPLRGDSTPHYSFEVQLEEASFTFEFRWNVREEYWTLDISDVEGAILTGRKVVVGLPMFSRFKDPRLPAGDVVAMDTTGANLDPALEDFGTRVTLLYLTAEELAGLADG